MSINPITSPDQWAQAFRQMTGREPTQADYDTAVRAATSPTWQPHAPGQPAPALGQVAPTHGQPSPAHGQPAPTHGQVAPAYGLSVPAHSQPASTDGQAAPAYGQMPSLSGQTTPAYGQLPPTGGQPAASYASPAAPYGVQPSQAMPAASGPQSLNHAGGPVAGPASSGYEAAAPSTSSAPASGKTKALRAFFQPRFSLSQVGGGFQALAAGPQTHLPQLFAVVMGVLAALAGLIGAGRELSGFSDTMDLMDFLGFPTTASMLLVDLVDLVAAVAAGALVLYMSAAVIAVPAPRTSVKAALSSLALPVALIVVPLFMLQVVFRLLNGIIHSFDDTDLQWPAPVPGLFNHLKLLLWPHETSGRVAVALMLIALLAALVLWLVGNSSPNQQTPSGPAPQQLQQTAGTYPAAGAPFAGPSGSVAGGPAPAAPAGGAWMPSATGQGFAPGAQAVPPAGPAFGPSGPTTPGGYGQFGPSSPTAGR